MFNIAVVEDNDQDAKAITTSLTRYAAKNQLEFQITRFSDGLKLINTYKSNFDLIFMDIEMPHMSGMEAAKALRRIDYGVTLVFVTNMAQYAVEGYAVEAFDYILKPVNDYALELKLKRIMSHVGSAVRERIVIRTEGETIGLQLRKIYYVEVDGHYLNWHTRNQVCRSLGTLKSIDQQLPESYCAISRWHVVNMQYVRSVVGDEVLVEDEKLRIGRSYKQKFLHAYAEYMVGGS
jgi:DNA-binding LytR/AlgR family response regulator